jgi:outer membrane receptor for ferrienterochelin and colicin
MKILPILLLFFYSTIFSQNFTVSGYITDENGEPLPSASVIDSISQRFTQTNNYGYFIINLNKTPSVLQLSFVGSEKYRFLIENSIDTAINIKLKSVSLKELVVKANKYSNEKISSITLPIEQIKKIPAIGGEVDIIKALSLTPGVSSGTEGSAGLFVRGGTPDQNLILLDDAIVYNPNHLFGLVSVFNPDAVKNIELVKGGFPARYGGRLSSVLDITMKEGNLEKKKTDFGIGLVSSRLVLERPLIKNKMSLLVAARSSYLGLALLPSLISYNSSKLSKDYFNYFLYDINIKLNYKLNDKSQLIFSLYHGKDDLRSFESQNDYSDNRQYIQWGNTTATLRYNKLISKKLFLKSMIIYSQFGYGTKIENIAFDSVKTRTIFNRNSGLKDYTIKTAFDYFPNNENSIKVGIETTIHDFTPQSKTYETSSPIQNGFDKTEKISAIETSFYIEDELKIAKNLKSNIGFRLNNYTLKNKSYASYEPRFSISYNLFDWILKAAYSKMQQNIHLLTSSGVGFQNDLWVPSTEIIKPQKSQQVALGLSRYLKNWDVEMSLEIYYKQLNDLIDYKEGIKPLTDLQDWEKTVEANGQGESKGIEFFLHKKTGRLSGFLSYTLANTTRQFSNINNGEIYPFRYDARHNFAFTFNYQLSRKWDFSATFVYKTGEPITVPVYIIDGIDITNDKLPNTYFIYSKRNGYRMPDYHRADIAFNNTKITKKGRKRVWSFSIFNVYNRANPSYVVVATERTFDNSTQKYSFKQQLVAKSIFPIVPSVSYSLSFQ